MATVMRTTATGSRLQYVVNHVEPVKRSLFLSLTASEVSLVASLLDYRLTESESERWLNPIRDMPEHEPWIKKMLRAGHAVTLIGNDVSLLLHRIDDPVTFWNRFRGTEDLVIWLSVLHCHANMEHLGENYRDHHQYRSVTTDDVEPQVLVFRFRERGPGERMSTMFLVPPGGFTNYAEDSEGSDWYRSTSRNKSKLTLLFFQSAQPYDSSTVACIKAIPSSNLEHQSHSLSTFEPKLVEEVQSSNNNAKAFCVQTTFLNLNSSKQAYSARATIKPPPGLMLAKLRIALDVPHVFTRFHRPSLVVPVSFHSTGMVSYARSAAA